MQPTNKIALITGGSRGLGRNTAVNLARNGIDVLLTYHSNKKEADSAVAEIVALGRKAVAIQLDTGNVGASRTLRTVYGRRSPVWGPSVLTIS